MFRKIIFPAVLIVLALVSVTHPKLFGLAGGSLAMAISVKDVTASAAKYSRNAGQAVNDYKTGVQNSGQKWHDATKASSDNFAAGVQQAISDGRFAKGVDKAGPDRYASRAAGKGGNAFAAGVQAGQARWAQNVAPFLQVLQGANLPPRGPKGDPRNQQRSQMVADILRKKKVTG